MWGQKNRLCACLLISSLYHKTMKLQFVEVAEVWVFSSARPAESEAPP